ncbi:MAG: glycosyltransferase [Desulfovibrionaceae bacterium]|nr:glycosyltransferase [Desulfovibrionaceae bacterium]
MKIDLHVHTKHSTRPSQWVLQKIGCPESFVEPLTAYAVCRARGMDLVTVTDHNVIDGALEIAHLPGAFVSEEITTFFPEDGCKAHVLAYDITEAVHADVQHLRANIYDLVGYLQRAGVRHAVAHPLFAVNDKLTVAHFEKMLLLFKTMEHNGARDAYQNMALDGVLAALTPQVIDELAERHGIVPAFAEPWVKHVVAGSDDHSGLNLARMFSEIDGPADKDALLAALDAGTVRPGGRASTPKTMAHNLFSIAYQFFKQRYDLGRHVPVDPLLRFLDRCLSPEKPPRRTLAHRVKAAVRASWPFGREEEDTADVRALLRAEAERVIAPGRDASDGPGGPDGADNAFARVAEQGPNQAGTAPEDLWFDFCNRTAGRVLGRMGDRILDDLSKADIFDVFRVTGSAGGLYTALSPYFVAYPLFAKERAFCREVLDRLGVRGGVAGHGPADRLAHFTDTFHETNGVALTLREHLHMAAATGKVYDVLTCAREGQALSGVVNFTPIGTCELPEYPELAAAYPPVLEILAHLYETGYTRIHSATPGPMGLVALLAARILKLPISGTYHTAFPQYARDLTGDTAMEELTWQYMVWYYNQMDTVYVPSRAVGDELAARGVAAERILVYPRGVDTGLFTPAKRNGFFKKYGLNGSLKLLYVGRVSREKNMAALERAYAGLAERHPGVELVVVGDGPYREQMQKNLEGRRCLFTGTLLGDDLAAAYASSDLFVFPSTTDTFGRVVLEAQASGLPVVVTDQGGPHENLVDGETGMVVGAEDAALASAMETLIADPDRLREMGRRARSYCEKRSTHQAFEETWRMYCSR